VLKFLLRVYLLTPNDRYSGRTAPLTSKCCILYIYSTNICTEYFKHGIYCPLFFSLQNAVCFIILTYLVPVLFTFNIQNVLKLKKNNSGAKRLKVLRVLKCYLIQNMRFPIPRGILKCLKHVFASPCTFSLRAATSKFVFSKMFKI